jgi:NADH:ubiquinone oxidoreductase subunit 5 (subunit L)/multisubunit Na+/H+ antiporter MnhA subunit
MGDGGMVDAAHTMDARPQAVSGVERLTGAVLLCLMAIGSLAMWTVVPLACLWVGSKIAGSSAEEYVIALPLTIVSMLLLGMLLSWLNRLYLAITGVLAQYEAEEEELGVAPRYLRGPLEPILVTSLVIALAVMFVWFFLLARDPPLVPL